MAKSLTVFLLTILLLTAGLLLAFPSFNSSGQVFAAFGECRKQSGCQDPKAKEGQSCSFIGPNYCCGAPNYVCNDIINGRCVNAGTPNGCCEGINTGGTVYHNPCALGPSCNPACAGPTPPPCDPNAFAACDSSFGTCGWRDQCGGGHNGSSPAGWCCKRVCQGANCVTISSGLNEANQCDNNAQCCATTAPDAPTLVSPEHGATITTDSVTLTWNAISNWGNQCGDGTQDVYRVYMDTSSSPTTQRCVVNSGNPTNCPVSGLADQTTYYWKVRADSGVRQTDSTTRAFLVNLIAGPWWQVRDADVQSAGNLSSIIPAQCTSPSCTPEFDLPGIGGYPGVPAYGGSSASFGSGTVSARGWLANSAYAGNRYDYAYFSRLAPPKAQMVKIQDSDLDIDGVLPGGYFVSNSATEKVNWFYREGDLTIKGTANMNVKRAVILVEGNLYLGTGGRNVNLRVKDGTGFLGFFVRGNIIISPETRDDDPADSEPWALEAILMADGTITTGTFGSPTNDYQLPVRGSWAAWGGLSLQRDLDPTKTTGANNTKPAEFFEYAADLLFTFPRELARRGIVWREVAP